MVKLPLGVSDNSDWKYQTRALFTTIDAGAPYGKALELSADCFAQIVFGSVAINKERKYVVSCDVQSAGQSREMAAVMRKWDAPYTPYGSGSVTVTAGDWTPQWFTFAGVNTGDAVLFLVTESIGVVRIDNLVIQEITE